MKGNYRAYILTSVGVIVGSFLVFGFAVFWFLGQAEEVSSNILTKRTTIQSQAQQLEALALFKERESNFASFEEKIDLLLPVKDELFKYRQSLETKAFQNDVRLDFDFRGESPGDDTAFGFALFAISADGSLDALRSFFFDIDNQGPQYLIRFDSFDINRQGAESYRVTAQGRVYHR
jgi:hypothetical protein